MPDQVLCKQNQRRILEERQRRWMEERAHVMESSNRTAKKEEAEALCQNPEGINEAHASYSRYKKEQQALTKLSGKAKKMQLQKMRGTWSREKAASNSEDRPSLPAQNVIQHLGSACDGLSAQSERSEIGTSKFASQSATEDIFDMEDDSTELAEIQDFLLA